MTEQEFQEKHLTRLTPQQIEAVKAVDGAILLLAVPGSGKTTTLATRLGYMVLVRGIDPRRILTMTYTTAATKDMRQRFASMFGQEAADRMEFRTINGVSAKVVDYYSKSYGKGRPFRLLDNDGEVAGIIAKIYQELANEYATESTIKDIRTGITYIKNMMLSPEEIKKLDVGVEKLPEIYERYCSRLKELRAMDYDDQMVYALAALKKYPGILAHYQEQFPYVCVDESQDTSKIQHEIIKLLVQKSGNIFMVGDEDQSIYGFRAAYPEALMSFESDYPSARVLLMEQNFRSTTEIVSLANAFVARNRFRREKTIVPTQGSGLAVQRIQTVDRATQYKFLCQEAQSPTGECAVLFRNNDSALVLIDMLERGGIPYSFRSIDSSFFSHRIVNDIRSIVRFASHLDDSEAFMQIYYKFGCPISKKAAQNACKISRSTGKDILSALLGIQKLDRYTRERIQDMKDILPSLSKTVPGTALNLIWNTLQYKRYVEAHNLDAGKLFVLQMLGANEPDVEGLLQRLDELRAIVQNHKNPPDTHILLSTIHSAKGLEYERVFLLDVLDGILPSVPKTVDMSKEDVRIYEEERRLYYVAITRAKRELFLFDCAGSESSFTDEALAALPIPVTDQNDFFAFIRENLCGRLYRDRERGQGRITAQCRDKFLVEYNSGEVQLLTLAQMVERRDTTVTYQASKPKNKKAEQKHFKSQKFEKDLIAAHRMSSYRGTSSKTHAKKTSASVPMRNDTVGGVPSSQEMVKRGSRMNSAAFGVGTVIDLVSTNGSTIVTIRFDKSGEEKRFLLQSCLRTGLLTILK